MCGDTMNFYRKSVFLLVLLLVVLPGCDSNNGRQDSGGVDSLVSSQHPLPAAGPFIEITAPTNFYTVSLEAWETEKLVQVKYG